MFRYNNDIDYKIMRLRMNLEFIFTILCGVILGVVLIELLIYGYKKYKKSKKYKN